MATPFNDIFKVFLGKITDAGLLINFTDTEKEEMFKVYLVSAQVRFKRNCKKNLTDRDDILMQYNETLDEEEINILATGMTYFWLAPKVSNVDNMQIYLSSKDVVIQHSPANTLKELRALRADLQKEFKQSIIDYSYNWVSGTT